MRKWIKWAAVVAVFSVVGAYAWGELNKPHRNISSEQPVAKFVPADLLAVFEADPTAAQALYADQAVVVFGVISSLDGPSFSMEGGVVGNWSQGSVPQGIKVGSLLKIQARVLAYDDLFSEVRLDQAYPLVDSK